MGYEIERKFLVRGEFKSKSFDKFSIKQGYLALLGYNVVRIRVRDDKGFITIKTAAKEGAIIRNEWEYEIPVADANEMLNLCEDSVLDKTRYLIKVGNHVFEVDEFHGENDGLLIAEIELKSETEEFEKPEWLGVEVTGNVRYYNSFLSIHPYNGWQKDE